MNRFQSWTLLLLVFIAAVIAASGRQIVAVLREDADRRFDQAQMQNLLLLRQNRILSEKLGDVVQKQNWLRASNAGRCHPELQAIIADAWGRSAKTLTLPETLKLAWVESNCQPFARNGAALGLFQVDPCSVALCYPGSATRLLDPKENARLAMGHLDDLARIFPTKTRILTAWNFGATRTRDGITTEEFARKVLKP